MYTLEQVQKMYPIGTLIEDRYKDKAVIESMKIDGRKNNSWCINTFYDVFYRNHNGSIVFVYQVDYDFFAKVLNHPFLTLFPFLG